MSYSVKEAFYTIQGEGMNAGRAAVFLRLAGCNLWDGKPEHRDRGKGACARWCDTDFANGTKMSAEQIRAMLDLECDALRFVDHVCVSPKLGAELKVHVADELKVVLPGELNSSIGWTDEALAKLRMSGDWHRLYVQPMDPPLSDLISDSHLHRHLLSIPGMSTGLEEATAERYKANVARCVEFVKANPIWRLSMQTHKFADIR